MAPAWLPGADAGEAGHRSSRLGDEPVGVLWRVGLRECGILAVVDTSPSARLPGSFTRAIVLGARERDLVRMHGAIVAALEYYPPGIADRVVFRPALTMLHSGVEDLVAIALATAAIARHTHTAPPDTTPTDDTA